MSGGNTTFKTCRAISMARSTTGRTGGRKVTISAEDSGTGTATATDADFAAICITPPS